MFGNPSLAAWGTSQWGTPLLNPGALSSVDSVASGDLDVTAVVDSHSGLFDVEREASVDSIVSGTLDVAVAVDYAPVSLPPGIFNKTEIAPYILLELLLPGGPFRVSGRCQSALGSTWDGRLINTGQILRTIGAGTDDVQAVLDDTDTNGQARFRDIVAAADPEGSLVNIWLGADGTSDAEHLLVFQGKLEQVSGLTYTEARIRILRREAVEDRLLGALVDQVTFPSAPPDSISRMLPVVFGTLNAHEGVVTDTLEIATLTLNVFSLDTFRLPIGDASLFPGSGAVEINGEQILYASRNLTELLFLTRGANGTIAADHGKGDEVHELGVFVVRLAGHALPTISDIRLLLPSGNLGEPVPQPDVIDTALARLQWNEIPKIRDPDASAVYQRVHFKDIDPINTAVGPQFAARENPGYEAFKPATLVSGAQLVLQANTEGLGQPGDIQRVWLGVIFDPKASATNPIASIVTRVGSGLVGPPVVFRLQPTDIMPDVIARNDEKTGDRFYDVPPPTADVTKPAEQSFTCTPEVVVHPGIFAFQALAKKVVDKDEDTCAAYMFVGVGEVQIVGTADAIFRLPDDVSVANKLGVNGAQIVTAQLVFVAGWDQTPFSSHFDVWLRKDGAEIPGTRFKACTLAGTLCTGLIRGKERFVHTITPAIAAQIDDKTEWVIHPALGVSNGLWVGCELLLEGTFQPPAPVVDISQDTRNTVTNYFEVTDQLATSASVGGAIVRDWGWFDDLDQGGQITFAFFGGPQEQGRIIETFYVVEYKPFVDTGTQIPRVFADVSGQVTNGNPADIMQALVTGAPPLGLGLPATRYDQAAYQNARSSYSSDQVRADFAVHEQVSVLRLLETLAAQCDSRQTWENAVHRVIRLPRADTALPVVLTITDCDLLTRNPISISRSARGGVINSAVLRWSSYAPNDGETSRTVVLSDAPSQASFGVQERVLDLDLIASDATANLVGTRKLERVSVPRWVVQFEMPLYGLNLRLGDLVALTHRDFTFAVGEVTQVNLVTAGEKKVRVQVAVWNK